MNTFFIILAIYIATALITNAIRSSAPVERRPRGYYDEWDPRSWDERGYDD